MYIRVIDFAHSEVAKFAIVLQFLINSRFVDFESVNLHYVLLLAEIVSAQQLLFIITYRKVNEEFII